MEHRELVLEVENLCRELRNLEMRFQRTQCRKNKLEYYRKFVQATLQIQEKGVYASQIRGLICEMAIRNCPLGNVGEILDCLYQNMKPLIHPSKRMKKISMDRHTVSRIMHEAMVSARLQMFVELIRTPCKSRISFKLYSTTF